MLLHVVIHLLLLVGSILIVLEFVVFVFVKITLTLFINLILQILIFKHEILFVTIMFIKLSLFIWGQLLSKMMSPRLSQGDYPCFLFSSPLPYLSIVGSGFNSPPGLSLHLLPILYLDPLALLIEVVVQQ